MTGGHDSTVQHRDLKQKLITVSLNFYIEYVIQVRHG